jgi:hypothetical protein
MYYQEETILQQLEYVISVIPLFPPKRASYINGPLTLGLVGCWERNNFKTYIVIEYRKDGQFYMLIQPKNLVGIMGGGNIGFKGEWKLEGNILEKRLTQSTHADSLNDDDNFCTNMKDQIEVLNERYLKLKGTETIYTRVDGRRLFAHLY